MTRPCPACVTKANPFTKELGDDAAPTAYVCALSDAKAFGSIDSVVGDLCAVHRSDYDAAQEASRVAIEHLRSTDPS